jgi:hypothetical protein
MSAQDGRFRPDAPVTSLELAQFCATRLGRTPPLKDWSQVTHGEFLALAAGLMG